MDETRELGILIADISRDPALRDLIDDVGLKCDWRESIASAAQHLPPGAVATILRRRRRQRRRSEEQGRR
jgi:hypothetical protein